MDAEVEREIRKIRKKLRQIEKLQEKADDLTQEECRKIRGQHDLRAQLQTLLAASPSATSSLPTAKTSGREVSNGGGGEVGARSGQHLQVGGGGSGGDADSSYSELDSSAASFDSSMNFDDSGCVTIPHSSEAAASEKMDSHFIEEPFQASEGEATADQREAATESSPPDTSGRVTPPPIIALTPSSTSTSPKEQPTSQKPAKAESKKKPAAKEPAAAKPAKQLTEKERQQAERTRFQEALRSARFGWESSLVEVTHLGGDGDIDANAAASGSGNGGLGITCVDCDGDLVISGGRDTTVRSWSVSYAAELHSLTGHKDTVTCIHLLPTQAALPEEAGHRSVDDRFAVSASRDCTVRVWNVTRGKPCRSVYTFAPVICMAWTSRALATGADSGRVQLWSWPGLVELCSLRVHEEAITCVQLHGRLLVTGDAPGSIKLWEVSQDMSSARPIPSLASVKGSPLPPQGQTSDARSGTSGGDGSNYRSVQSLCMPSRQYLLWGDDGVNLKILNTQTGSVGKFTNHLGPYGRTDSMALSAGGDLLLSSAYDLDSGEGYVNVRSASNLQYFTTLHATMPNDIGGFGHIRALACTSSSAAASGSSTGVATSADGGGDARRHRWCVGGDGLAVFDVVPQAKPATSKKAAKKSATKDYVSAAEFRFTFSPELAGQAEDSDVESSEDEDDDTGDGCAGDNHGGFDADTEDEVSPLAGSPGAQRRRRKRDVAADDAVRLAEAQGWWLMRWCTIL